MSSIVTYSGQMFDYKNPSTWKLNLDDVFVPLSRMPRFSGATSEPYSVLFHSIFVASIVEVLLRESGVKYTEYQYYTLAKIALLHDASEAFMCDIPTPLKNLLPDYKVIEKNVEDALYEAFGLDIEFVERYNGLVKIADTSAYHVEKSIAFDHVDINESKKYLYSNIGERESGDFIDLWLRLNDMCPDAKYEVEVAKLLLAHYDEHIAEAKGNL